MFVCACVLQCSTPCGNGTQRRDVICVQKLGSDFSVKVAGECAHLEKPSPIQTCELEPCEPQWFSTEWSAVRTWGVKVWMEKEEKGGGCKRKC